MDAPMGGKSDQERDEPIIASRRSRFGLRRRREVPRGPPVPLGDRTPRLAMSRRAVYLAHR